MLKYCIGVKSANFRHGRNVLNLILCVDKVGGMLFNNRRVSRDREVTADILKTVKGERLFVKPYSLKLFSEFDDYSLMTVCNDPLNEVSGGEWCFIEDEDVTPYLDKVERLLIYNWNREYPFELGFDMKILDEQFRLTDKRKFVGYSHEEITREIYRKQIKR